MKQLGLDKLSDKDDGEIEPTSIGNAWITKELLAETIRVWSKAYGREVSSEESMEILLNVKRVATLLVEQRQGIK